MKSLLGVLALSLAVSGCSSLGLSGINSPLEQVLCRFTLDSKRVDYAQRFLNTYSMLDPATDQLIIDRYAPYVIRVDGPSRNMEVVPVASAAALACAEAELAQYLDTKWRTNGTFRSY